MVSHSSNQVTLYFAYQLTSRAVIQIFPQSSVEHMATIQMDALLGLVHKMVNGAWKVWGI